MHITCGACTDPIGDFTCKCLCHIKLTNIQPNVTVGVTYQPSLEKPKSFFNQAMQLIQEIHDKKVHDYAADDNEFSNFEFAATFARAFVQDSFNTLIGVKQSRLLELTKSGKEPKNESLLDTYLDRAIYAIIAYAYELKRQEKDGPK